MYKFPFFLQHDAMDCGPTCLRMIAAHYGRRYSLLGRIFNLTDSAIRKKVTRLEQKEAAKR